LKSGGAWDAVARGFGLIGLALPNFWLGTLLILLFARYLHWMPNTGGYVDLLVDPAANLRFLIFPAFTLGVAMAAVVMRTTRSGRRAGHRHAVRGGQRLRRRAVWRPRPAHSLQLSPRVPSSVWRLSPSTFLPRSPRTGCH